jgi:hypothetical protein
MDKRAGEGEGLDSGQQKQNDLKTNCWRLKRSPLGMEGARPQRGRRSGGGWGLLG